MAKARNVRDVKDKEGLSPPMVMQNLFAHGTNAHQELLSFISGRQCEFFECRTKCTSRNLPLKGLFPINSNIKSVH